MAQLAAIANHSPRVQAQLKLADEIHGSEHISAQRALGSEINSATPAAQLKPKDKKLAQPKFDDAAQAKHKDEKLQRKLKEEKPRQRKYDGSGAPAQLEEAPLRNNTGLPDNLKSGVENLSGVSLNNVKVHYNSPKPAQLNALAYAQGTDIHVAPGQEKHLPHETWHIAQQSQGRVKATTQAKGVAINDDSGLEHEADVMGAKAASVQMKPAQLADKYKKK